MSIKDDVQKKLDESTAQKMCKFATTVFHLDDPDDQQALIFAVENVRKEKDIPQAERFFTVKWLTDLCIKNKLQLGKTVVSEHIRGVCSCE